MNRRAERSRIPAFVLVCLLSAGPAGAAPAELSVTIAGQPVSLFEVAKRPCGVFTMPDINARAFRDDKGQTRLFTLDQENRSFVGPSLLDATPTCVSSLPSGEKADPAAFDGRRYITSTWTFDGRAVAALVHNEYHAETHPGRCTTTNAMACWYNAIIAVRSNDGGARFAPASPLVVAAPPFRQDFDQTRHRGFFNPSNMFAGPGGVYVFTSTTGWPGQKPGACLLRNPDPLDSAGWRGYDGEGFFARWSDPYGSSRRADPCQPVKPFGFPVAAVARHRPTGLFLAIWEQPAIEGRTPFGVFPAAGFYLATSRDLIEWSDPALFLKTAIVHQPCGLRDENRGGSILSYPSLLDDKAQGRNYDNVGDAAYLYFTRIGLDGCNPGARRVLMRQPVVIGPPGSR